MGILRGKVGNADKIKANLIDFLLEHNDFKLIINEVPFLSANRWADIVAIHDNTIVGFEIKSDQDNLKTLSSQLSDYIKVFNEVYLVLAEKFINNFELNNISKSIGLIIIKGDFSIEIKRKAKSKNRLDKKSLMTLLWRKDLEQLCPLKKNAELSDLRDFVLKTVSLKKIQEKVISALDNRYGNAYRLFLKDRGNYTTIEDLRTITKIKKPPVF
ncbi:MAG: sce7726 family protein [Alphaproteobacteria bacterium]|nr:sce7726 family protein [Alphaproteobacteria bacterium]